MAFENLLLLLCAYSTVLYVPPTLPLPRILHFATPPRAAPLLVPTPSSAY